MRLRFSILATLLFVSLCLSKSAAAGDTPASTATSSNQTSSADSGRFKTEVTDHLQLPNFHEVHPYLYRSGAPNEVGLKEAKDKGIRTIIDLRNPGEIKQKGDEELWAKQLGLKYINIPMGPQAPSKENVELFLSTVKRASERPEQGAVLVHCAHGSDRTGCLIGIWRVNREGWSYDRAYDEMRHYWFSPKYTQLSGAVKEYCQK